jgi:hypothetical protein
MGDSELTLKHWRSGNVLGLPSKPFETPQIAHKHTAGYVFQIIPTSNAKPKWYTTETAGQHAA